MWFVINEKSGKVIATCGYKPDEDDLRARGEICIEAEPLDIEDAVAVFTENGWSVKRREGPRYVREQYVRTNEKLDAMIEWAKSLGFTPPWEIDTNV